MYELAGYNSYDEFRKNHRDWVTEVIVRGENIRDSKWTQSIAEGSEKFKSKIKEDLCISSKGIKVDGTKDVFQLRETKESYNADFDTQKIDIEAKNGYLWYECEVIPVD